MNLTFDYYHNLQETEFYLCNPDGRELFPIVGFDRKLTLRFNDLSQLTFSCYSTTTSNDGAIVNVDAYEYVQTRRLIFATGIGWFVITNVEEVDNGVTKTKNVTCDSLQATLKDRGFYCEERVYYFYNPSDPTDANYDPNNEAHVPSVMGQLYQQLGIQQDLQQGTSDPSTPYDDWTITYINPDLVGKGRNFKESTDYGYEWIVKSVEEAYGVIVLFDFFYKTIHVMKPSEVTAKANVIYTFSNFMKEVEIEESAENIVTVMDCKGDNCDIIGVNPTGTDYICDFSYYMDDAGRWMSSALKAKINAWKAAVEEAKPGYEEKVQQLRAAYGNLTSVRSTLQEVSKIYQDLVTAVSEKAVAIASGKVAMLGNLPAGTKIKIPHSVYGNIIFQVADQNHDGYPSNSTTLITEKIILLRCFDAKEPSNPNSDRASSGNNRYSKSNIDQWLNSSASAGQWYSARHEYDAPPTNSNVYYGYNEYDQDAGFLNGFDEAFVGALKDTTLTVALNTVTDGGGSETITRKMFLASKAEVFGSAENGIMEGGRLAIFAENTSESRIAKVSAYAAAHSEYSVTENQNLGWFLRTPSSASSRLARVVLSGGLLYDWYAYGGSYGVRPLCNLDSGIFVSRDADGNYVLSDNPGGIVWCETVNVGETSIDDESVVYHNALSREMIITVYKDQPSYDQNAKVWQFSGSSFTGTLDECFAYTDEGNYAYRYFSDYLSSGDTYCVLQGDTRVNPTTYAVEYVCKGFKRYTALVLANGWTQKYDARKAELKSLQETYESTVDEKREELAEISESLNIISFFSDTPLLLKELHHYWIEGEYTNDNIVVDERTTNEEEIDLEHELLESGEVELAKVCQPKIQFSLTSADCMRQYEFRNQMRELELGKIVTVEKEEGVWYYPALLCIELDLDKSDSFSMQFANALKLDDWGFTYGDLMSSAASTSRQVTANWQNITAYSKDKAEISALIKDPLSSTLRASFANMTNQEFTVNENGILGRRFANENRDSFEDEQVRLINNVMLFTDDNWETARAAFGKITYTDDNNQPVTAYGLIGEAIIGNLLMGETLKIRNTESSIVLDANGLTIKNGNTVVLSADINGNVTARGTIYATSGDIGGWVIDDCNYDFDGTPTIRSSSSIWAATVKINNGAVLTYHDVYVFTVLAQSGVMYVIKESPTYTEYAALAKCYPWQCSIETAFLGGGDVNA